MLFTRKSFPAADTDYGRVEITLNERSFQYWDERAQAWTKAPGVRTIWVGESSRDLRLSDQTKK